MPSLPLVNKKRVKQVKTPKTLKTDKPMPINSTETTVNKPTKEAWPSQPAELMLSSTHDESRYSLLDLPREIRQEIFGYLLPYTKPDDEEPSGVVWVKGSTTLLPVCRQLYGEYACFMYLKNTWCFTIARNTVYMRTWVQDNGKVTKLSGRLANVKTQLLEYMKNVVIRIELSTCGNNPCDTHPAATDMTQPSTIRTVRTPTLSTKFKPKLPTSWIKSQVLSTSTPSWSTFTTGMGELKTF